MSAVCCTMCRMRAGCTCALALDSFLAVLDSCLVVLSGILVQQRIGVSRLSQCIPLSSVSCKVACQLSASGWGWPRVLSIPREFGLFSRTLESVGSETRDETRLLCARSRPMFYVLCLAFARPHGVSGRQSDAGKMLRTCCVLLDWTPE